ncbi:hypothetical protein SSPO_039300 [Streptomyces antimycoticus]|uniref:Uncharacterized protein n=1 Tax=Streptomyces antimycoticus TaxID=68175 RepID=A0A499UK69_9ACTN|nr:hypothetical protein SSPO_039300 [Streptomyces antimycoticus]
MNDRVESRGILAEQYLLALQPELDGQVILLPGGADVSGAVDGRRVLGGLEQPGHKHRLVAVERAGTSLQLGHIQQ